MDILFQNMYDIISQTLPDSWDKLVIHASFFEDACDIKYYVRQKGKGFQDCFSLDLSKDELLSTLHFLYEEITAVRKSLPEKDRWNDITVIIDDEGNLNTKYDYEGSLISDENCQKAWLSKYLK